MGWRNLAYKELQPHLLKGEIEHCIKRTCEELNKLPDSPFHVATSLKFTNDPEKTAKYIDKFIKREKKDFTIKAIYTETNGFDINPYEWYFELFAYDNYGGHDDEYYDWLAYWQSEKYTRMILTGMEELQDIYERREEIKASQNIRGVVGYASLLVVLKFQEMIRNALPLSKELNCPFLASSHDYDFIYEFKP